MRYSQNDYELSSRITGQTRTRADKQAQNYQGHYVYPNDAEDIKAHPFFHGLSWDRLHLSRPPFVPDIKGQEDTKYFDDDEEISDIEDISSYSVVNEAIDPDNGLVNAAAGRPVQVDGAEGAQNASLQLKTTEPLDKNGNHNDESKDMKPARIKEKKRPRDRVLRDKEVARRVLEIRRKGAFIGYTYRRPKGVFQGDRGRYSGPWSAGRTDES